MAHPKQFTVKPVGVSFVEDYPDNLYSLADVFQQEGHHEEGLPVVLQRNPANEHDPNAVEVHVPIGDVGMIGHIPAAVVRWLAPAIDSGEIWHATITEVRIHPDHTQFPNILIEARQVA